MLAFFVNKWLRQPLYIFAIENGSICPPRQPTEVEKAALVIITTIFSKKM